MNSFRRLVTSRIIQPEFTVDCKILSVQSLGACSTPLAHGNYVVNYSSSVLAISRHSYKAGRQQLETEYSQETARSRGFVAQQAREM